SFLRGACRGLVEQFIRHCDNSPLAMPTHTPVPTSNLTVGTWPNAAPVQSGDGIPPLGMPIL
ncbi:MAG TPA: hypothetical protein VNJ09_09865, partial [Chthonomonadales bacterium]|nr:hypothetical protein [Chthonomonadales bacterium]